LQRIAEETNVSSHFRTLAALHETILTADGQTPEYVNLRHAKISHTSKLHDRLVTS
jgi:hypothetical protein